MRQEYVDRYVRLAETQPRFRRRNFRPGPREIWQDVEPGVGVFELHEQQSAGDGGGQRLTKTKHRGGTFQQERLA
jgi:hypothetical protein